MSSDIPLSTWKAALAQLEQLRSLDDHLVGEAGQQRRALLKGVNWLRADGVLTHIMAPYFDSELETEVEVDHDAAVYRYQSVERRSQAITRPIEEITCYCFEIGTFLDGLAALLGIAERFASSRLKPLVADNLWYLGDVRIADSRAYAPIFFCRYLDRLLKNPVAMHAALSDARFSPGGIVLYFTARETSVSLPNRHQIRPILDFMVEDGGALHFDLPMLGRVLMGLATDVNAQPAAWFDETTGRLKLPHLPEVVTFVGIQKKIIKVFWDARLGVPLSWAEVKVLSGSTQKGIDGAFGKDVPWCDWIEKVRHGKYRIHWQG